jgi:polar amino acid transport system permease protein
MAEINSRGQPDFSEVPKSPRRDSRWGRPPRIEVTDGALIPGKGEKVALSAWRIAFFGAIGILVLLCTRQWVVPFINQTFHIGLTFSASDTYWRAFRFILPTISRAPDGHIEIAIDGILRSLQVSVLSIFFSVFVGLMTGIGRISRIRIVNMIATIYVEIIRGIPLLVQIFYIYFALAKFIVVPDITAAVIAITICYGAYLGEIFRAGIQSVHRGQMEAAIALGLSRGQALTRIILPQTVRVVLPPIGNEFIALLKDSALVSILAVSDLLRRGKEFAAATFSYFESYTVVALVYLIMTLFLSRMVAIMEERLNKRGR